MGTSSVGHCEGLVVGLCMASWQLEFGWHVFCSLPCWDGGRKEGTKGWMDHGHMVHTGWGTPCPFPTPFPLILPHFPGDAGLGNRAGRLWGTRAAGPRASMCSTGCPVPQVQGGPVPAPLAAMLEASRP